MFVAVFVAHFPVESLVPGKYFGSYTDVSFSALWQCIGSIFLSLVLWSLTPPALSLLAIVSLVHPFPMISEGL